MRSAQALEVTISSRTNEAHSLLATIEREHGEATDDERRQIDRLLGEAHAAKAQLHRLKSDQALSTEINRLTAGAPTTITPAVPHNGGGSMGGGAFFPGSPILKSLGQQFAESEAAEFLRRGGHRSASNWRSPSTELFLPTLYGATLTIVTGGGDSLIAPQDRGVVPAPAPAPYGVADLLAVKTVNNVLTVLNTLMKKAVEWEVIERMPCTVRLLKIPNGSVDFYDFDEYQRLIAAAGEIDPRAYLIVLLAGDAGLRSWEIRALRWRDVDSMTRQICVELADWRGRVSATKGNRLRHVPMTIRLAEALRKHRHLIGPLVLYRNDRTPLTENVVRGFVERAAKRAGLRWTGPHMLRHTFCSHLAMRGAPAWAIQELAGHRDLATTQRYMHLSPAAVESAIRLLDSPGFLQSSGDILEAESKEVGNVNG